MADVPNKPTDAGTPQPQSGGSGLGGVLGGLAGALAGGVSAAAGGDIFGQFMETLRNAGKMSDGERERQAQFSIEKAMLAGRGVNVSGIKTREDLAVAQMQEGNREDSYLAAKSSAIEAAQGLAKFYLTFRGDTRPLNESDQRQIALYNEQYQGALAKMKSNRGYGSDPTAATQAWAMANEQGATINAHSDGMAFAKLIGNPEAAAKAWATMDEQTRQAATRHPEAALFLNSADKNLDLIYGLGKDSHGRYIGTGDQVALRRALETTDEAGNVTSVPREAVMRDPALMAQVFRLGDPTQQATERDKVMAEREAEVQQSAWTGTLGLSTDRAYRTVGGEFDAVRATEDFVAQSKAGLSALSPEALVNEQARVRALMAQAPDKGSEEALAQLFEATDLERRNRRGRDLDYPLREYEAAVNSKRADLKAGLARQGRFNADTPKNFDEWFGPIRQTLVTVQDPELRGRGAGRQVSRDVFARTMDERIMAHNERIRQDAAYKAEWGALTRYEQEALIYDGKLPEFDREGILDLAKDAVRAPLDLRVDLTEDIRTLERARDAAAGSGSQLLAADIDREIAELQQQQAIADVGRQALGDFGYLARDFWDEEQRDKRIMAQFPKLAKGAFDLQGLPPTDAVGLGTLEEDVAAAPSPDEAGRIFLQGLVRAQVNAASAQYPDKESRQDAQARMTATMSSISDAYDELLRFKEDEGLTDAQMAELLGAETPEQWWRPFFESL